MTEIKKEIVTTTTSTDAPVETVVHTTEPSSFYSIGNLVYLLFGILEVLLVFRFAFKLLGANPGNTFVSFIYTFTQPFVAVFAGIFPQGIGTGTVVTSVFETSTIIALIVYSLIAWGIVQLLGIIFGRTTDAI